MSGASEGLTPQQIETGAAIDRMTNFLRWSAANLATPEKVDKNSECHTGEHPDAGWCEGTFIQSNQMRSVKWLESDPNAVLMSSEGVSVDFRPTCKDFGYEQVRKWKWESAIVFHCQKGTVGMWIKHAESGTYLRTFTKEFVENNPKWAAVLRAQGTTIE